MIMEVVSDDRRIQKKEDIVGYVMTIIGYKKESDSEGYNGFVCIEYMDAITEKEYPYGKIYRITNVIEANKTKINYIGIRPVSQQDIDEGVSFVAATGITDRTMVIGTELDILSTRYYKEAKYNALLFAKDNTTIVGGLMIGSSDSGTVMFSCGAGDYSDPDINGTCAIYTTNQHVAVNDKSIKPSLGSISRIGRFKRSDTVLGLHTGNGRPFVRAYWKTSNLVPTAAIKDGVNSYNTYGDTVDMYSGAGDSVTRKFYEYDSVVSADLMSTSIFRHNGKVMSVSNAIEAIVSDWLAIIHIPEEPVIEEPVPDEPIVEEPVPEEPVPEEPVIEEPVIEEPVIEELV